MNFIKKFFAKEQQARQVSHPKELIKGDIIVMSDSFGLPDELRKQQFEITAVNSYEFEHLTETEWVLTGTNNNELFLTLDEDDKTYLKFALKIDRSEVESLFNLDEFSLIFEEPGQAFLEKQQTELYNGWAQAQYQQSTFAKVGYFHRKDHRSENLSAYEDQDAGEQFEQYMLLDKNQSYGIDVEVWQDGDTDVFLTCYRPITDIVDMFPGS